MRTPREARSWLGSVATRADVTIEMLEEARSGLAAAHIYKMIHEKHEQLLEHHRAELVEVLKEIELPAEKQRVGGAV